MPRRVSFVSEIPARTGRLLLGLLLFGMPASTRADGYPERPEVSRSAALVAQ